MNTKVIVVIESVLVVILAVVVVIYAQVVLQQYRQLHSQPLVVEDSGEGMQQSSDSLTTEERMQILEKLSQIDEGKRDAVISGNASGDLPLTEMERAKVLESLQTSDTSSLTQEERMKILEILQ